MPRAKTDKPPKAPKTSRAARAAKPKPDKPDKLAELREEARRVLHAALDLEAEQADGDTAYRAQDLFYSTDDVRQPGAVIRRWLKAVRTNPNNPDALSSLAGLVGGSLEERIAVFERIVAAGERDLGRQVFKTDRGYFWGILETRGYMRAKQHLVLLLKQAGRHQEAARQMAEMLELNPNDNQGMRYGLLGAYLLLGQLEAARKLWKQYEDEHSAFWAWGLVLLEFLSGDHKAAQQALAAARSVNPHAEAYLGGWKPMPKEMPDYYSPGQESEAIVCFTEIGAAWMKHPEAQRWLENQ